MSLETQCDICGKKYRFSDKSAGEIAECHECGAEFEIPTIGWWEALEKNNPDTHAMISVGALVSGIGIVVLLVGYGLLELVRSVTTQRPTDPVVAQAPPVVSQPVINPGLTPPASPVTQPRPQPRLAPAAMPQPSVDLSQPSGDVLGQTQLKELFEKSAALPTCITSIETDTQSPSSTIRIHGRGLKRAKQVLFLNAGDEPQSVRPLAVQDDHIICSPPPGLRAIGNSLVGLETPEGFVLSVPTYAIELRDKPLTASGFYFVPNDARPEQFGGMAQLLVLSGGTVTAPVRATGGVNTFILLEGATLEGTPEVGRFSVIHEDKANVPISELSLKKPARTVTRTAFPKIHLCPVSRIADDTYHKLAKQK